MRRLVLALLLAGAAALPLLVADAIWGIGFTPPDLAHRLSGMHWLFHLGTITLTPLGAWLALRTLDAAEPSWPIVVVVGLAFGAVSIAAVPAALVIGDAQGVAFWQFIGGMFAMAMACSVPRKSPTD